MNVKKDFSDILAAYLYSIYKYRANTLLAGKFAEVLTYAFSISVIGKIPYVLNCEGEYDQNLLKSALDTEDKIIVIKNGLRDEWVNILRTKLTNKNKTFIWISDNHSNISKIYSVFFTDTYPFITDIFFEREKSLGHNEMLYCNNIDLEFKELNLDLRLKTINNLKKYNNDYKNVDKILKRTFTELKNYRSLNNSKSVDPELFEMLMMTFHWGMALNDISMKNIVRKNESIKDSKYRFVIQYLKNIGD